MSTTPIRTRPTTTRHANASAPPENESGEPAPGPHGSLASSDVGPHPFDLGDRLGVLPWTGQQESGVDHDPRSAYVETFWLPVIGPSMTLLLRRLADEFDGAPDGFEVPTQVLSKELGLGPRLDARGTFAKTLDRAAKFQLLKIDGGIVHVRRRLPNLSKRQIRKLSRRLQALHAAWAIDPNDDGAQRRVELVRAAHLARTLLALGESSHDAERQLHRWHFHPSIAWHAVQWALSGPESMP